MPAERDRRHIIVREPPTVEGYTPHQPRVPAVTILPPAPRHEHGAALRDALTSAVDEAERRRAVASVTVPAAEPGLYIQPAVAELLEKVSDILEAPRHARRVAP